MLITKRSPISGKDNTLDIPITEEQFRNWQNGMLIQNAAPNLSDDHREFLISGILPDEWDTLFPTIEKP